MVPRHRPQKYGFPRMTASDNIAADAAGIRVAVLVSRYHVEITSALETGARRAFIEAGGDPEQLEIFDCPGAFELAGLASVALETGRFDAAVCLGCVIRGETSHDAWINSAVANELAALSSRHGRPAAFGVITCNDLDQARARSGGARGNKGVEAMQAAIAAVRVGFAIRHGQDGVVS
jgi:6,7-dimethyl-8-ribityllumazine synthase